MLKRTVVILYNEQLSVIQDSQNVHEFSYRLAEAVKDAHDLQPGSNIPISLGRGAEEVEVGQVVCSYDNEYITCLIAVAENAGTLVGGVEGVRGLRSAERHKEILEEVLKELPLFKTAVRKRPQGKTVRQFNTRGKKK